MSKKQPPAHASDEDFVSILPEGKYMYIPTRQMWEGTTVNRLLGNGATKALDKNKACVALTWAPGHPVIIKDTIIINGEWTAAPGRHTFNLYLPPRPITKGDPNQAGPWLDLGQKLFGDDLPHLLNWTAYRVQHPEIKINHSLVLGSLDQGTGKDSWLSALQRAVGRNNWKNVSAKKAMKEGSDGNNSFLESVILQVSEVHRTTQAHAREFYEGSLKDWAVSPPETIMVQDKWIVQHPAANLVGVVYTTNHKTDGLFIPADDRRLFVAWSPRRAADFAEEYWKDFYWPWLEGGGSEHVAAFLHDRDVSKWNPKAAPPKTEAWHEIVGANRDPDDAELADLLDRMGDDYYLFGESSQPRALTIAQIAEHRECPAGLAQYFGDRKNRRSIPLRLERQHYVMVANRDAADKLWTINGKRQAIYAQADLTTDQKLSAARSVVEWENVFAKARRPMTEAEQAAEDFGA